MIEEKLVTPPIRAAILEDKTPSRDWWLHWNALTLRANQNADDIDAIETNVAELVANGDSLGKDIDRLLRAGTHAIRIATPPGPIGALWAETDRSNVLYQAQTVAGAVVWRYAAGVMYGTLAPDQRPADLGANDGGFEFRATDTDPANKGRAFIWSGTAWVEITPAQVGLLQYAQAIGSLVLTNIAAPIPGATLTLARAGWHLITGCFDFVGNGAGDNDAVAIGQLNANGTAQAPLAVLRSLMIAGAGLTVNPANLRSTLFQQWAYFAATAGQVVLLQAWKNTGTGASVAADNTTISALWVSPT